MPGNLTSSAPDVPPFDEPWQAQVFAMAVLLEQRSVFTWSEWTKALGAEFAVAPGYAAQATAAVVQAATSAVLGTMVAFAMMRHRFKARSALNVLLFLPMAAPEVTMGMTLVTFFYNTIGSGSLGFWTIVIAHIMFSLSYVVVTVKARLAGMDPTLEKAAADLYATPLQTFRRVTLPLVMPGILAAALLSFALSIDDYIITVLTAGNEVTFPMYVYASFQHSVPAQIDVIGSVMLLVTLAGIVFAQVPQIIRTRRA